MAEENKDQKKFPAPPPLPASARPLPAPPPLPGLSASPPSPMFPAPPLPGAAAPPLPKHPGAPFTPAFAPPFPSGGRVPPGPALAGAAGAPVSPPFHSFPGVPTKEVDSEKREFEKRVAELEKRLQEEKEKALVLSLKSQEEAAAAARVEVSIKELQDKLRRDRRDQEQEESRLKLESRLAEMEQKLAAERETWVSALRNQVSSRDIQDKELETHFGGRLQEMERRWLEEKAQWQKALMAKEDEVRHLKVLAEKLRGVDGELARVSADKKWLESRLTELSQERAESMARLQAAIEKEKENVQLRSDITAARAAASSAQERLDLLAEKLRSEHEAALRRQALESESEKNRLREAAEKSGAEAQKLRGIAGALERQVASGRLQLSEAQKTLDRYKAEFVVLQRRWVEREKEMRRELSAQAGQSLEAEKSKLRSAAQEEIEARLAKAVEELKRQKESELKRAESGLRADLEREFILRLQKAQSEIESGRRGLEAEMERLRQELFRKDAEWSSRLLAKEAELHSLAVKEESARVASRPPVPPDLIRRNADLEALAVSQAEQMRAMQESLETVKRHLSEELHSARHAPPSA